ARKARAENAPETKSVTWVGVEVSGDVSADIAHEAQTGLVHNSAVSMKGQPVDLERPVVHPTYDEYVA
ncbi:hypothetical protein D5874_24530, partial [Salmonella enterica subsp. enterica serovar Newport]|nr:hypothetical protein [Salmonella enterica subsp. enterica serovar Newport]